ALDSPPISDVWVGKPMADPEHPGQLVIPIARLIKTGVTSTGWAGALFSFDGFDQLFDEFGAEVAVIGLIARDGTILVRSPKSARRAISVGSNVASSEIFRRGVAAGLPSGTVEGYGPILKREVIYGYTLLRGYPLYAVAGQSLESAL